MNAKNRKLPVAIFNPADGSLSIAGWPAAFQGGMREEELVWPDGVNINRSEYKATPILGKNPEILVTAYETPPVLLGGREVKLYLMFHVGVLAEIVVAIEGLEWWTKEGHAENVALRKRLFPKSFKFRGGCATVKFESNTGALYDGGTRFSVVYDEKKNSQGAKTPNKRK